MSGLDAELAINTAPDPAPTVHQHADGNHGQDASHDNHGGSREGGKVRHALRALTHREREKATPLKPMHGSEETPEAPEPFHSPEPPKTEHKLGDFVRDNSPESKNVEFKPELKQRYGNVLTNHINSLLHLRETNPNILDNPRFVQDKALFQDLTTDGKPDPAKIEAYLSTAKGLASANLLLENKARLMMFSMGLDVVAHGGPQKDPMSVLREMVSGEQSKEDKPDRGVVSSVIATAGGAAAGVTLQEGGGKLVELGQQVAQLVYEHPDVRAAVVGGSVGLLGNLVRRRALGSEGTEDHVGKAQGEHKEPELTEFAKGLNAIKQDPELAHYVREVAGIEAENFEVDSSGSIIVKSLSEGERRQPPNIAGKIKEVSGLLGTRKDFLKSLGYPDAQIEGRKHERVWRRKKGKHEEEPSGNDQLFTVPNTDGREQLPTWWDDEIELEYNRLLQQADKDESVELFTEARTRVAMRYHERAIEEAGIEPADKDKLLGNIEKGVKKLQGSEEENRERYRAEQDRINADQESLQSEISLTGAVDDVRKGYREVLTDFQSSLPGETDLEESIRSRTDRLKADAEGRNLYERERETEESIRDQEISSLRTGEKREQLERRVRDRVHHAHAVFEAQQQNVPQNKRRTSASAEDINAQIEQAIQREVEAEETKINERLNKRIEAISKKEDRDREELRQLLGYRQTIQGHEEAMREASMQEAIRNEDIQRDHDEISTDESIDLNRTADQLIDGESNSTQRQKLIHARLQHIKNNLMRNSGLNELDTSSMSETDAASARARFEQEYASLENVATRQAYGMVRQELERRKNELAEKAQTGEISSTDKKKIEQGQIILDLATHTTDIANRSRSVDFSKLTDTTNVADVKGEEFSESEKQRNVPVVYHRLLNILFDYQGGHDVEGKHLGRNEYFQKVAEMLPPKELAKMINESGIVGTGEDGIEEVANRIRDEYKDNAFTQVELRRLSRYITRRLIERTNAQF